MPSWAPTPAQVHQRIPTSAEGGFSADTIPTEAEVQGLIDQSVVDVVADVGQFDPAEIINAEQVAAGDDAVTLGEVARSAVALAAAWQIERSFRREQPVGSDDDETRLYRLWVDATERLRKLVATTRPQPRIHRIGTVGIRAPIQTSDYR